MANQSLYLKESSVIQKTVIIGQIPKRIILEFVKNKAYNGDRKLNPFNFQNIDFYYLSMYVDVLVVPSSPLQPVFTGNNSAYVEAYIPYLAIPVYIFTIKATPSTGCLTLMVIVFSLST